jgi:putative intracellular protease/amidase
MLCTDATAAAAAAAGCPAGSIISAVCHGPAGLVLAKGPDGSSLIKGKKVTGFTNSEEEAVGKTKVRRRTGGV